MPRSTPGGLLLMVDSLEKYGPPFPEPRAWARLAHRYYGEDLVACVEPYDALAFEQVLVLSNAPQDCHPVAPPPGYEPSLPAVRCA